MRKIVYICKIKEEAEDLQMEYQINVDDPSYKFYTACLENMEDEIENIKPDLVVLSYEVLISRKKWDFKNCEIAYHPATKKELEDGSKYGYPTIGIARDEEEMFEKLENPLYVPESKEKRSEEPVQNKKNKNSKKPEILEVDDFIDDDQEVKDSTKDDIEDNEAVYQEEETDEEEIGDEIKSDTKIESNDMEDDFEEDPPKPSKPKKLNKVKSQKINSKKNKNKYEEDDLDDPIEDRVSREFRRDSGKTKTETKVITVYSAKGGVGKTTISSELATYLALVNVRKRKLRVCIIDYNIDFGDVRSTVHMGADGLNLTHWAEEVQELMRKGKEPEDIYYSKSEIEDWLRRDKKSGLYVLPAPITNEDSMGIESEALSVILNNIIDNGEFDYVICDTGNNTRDSTMIALEKATTILLIMTQNVNTANCDKAFIETMKSIDFDLSNVKLVINSIMPQKSTSVSVQEIVDFFPYDCVGKLKFDTDVIKAGNLGEPLAFNPEHNFTKQLRSLVSYILKEGDFDSDAKIEKKKSLLDKLLRR